MNEVQEAGLKQNAGLEIEEVDIAERFGQSSATMIRISKVVNNGIR